MTIKYEIHLNNAEVAEILKEYFQPRIDINQPFSFEDIVVDYSNFFNKEIEERTLVIRLVKD